MCVSFECCVSSRGLCEGPIPRPEESYRLWCVTVCDLETSRMRRPWPRWAVAPGGNKIMQRADSSLKRRSAVAGLLESRFQIPLVVLIFVSCVCFIVKTLVCLYFIISYRP
jgi:hypothetical protein